MEQLQQQPSESVLYCATVSCHPICGYGDDRSPDKDRGRIFLRWNGVFEQNWLVEMLAVAREGIWVKEGKVLKEVGREIFSEMQITHGDIGALSTLGSWSSSNSS